MIRRVSTAGLVVDITLGALAVLLRLLLPADHALLVAAIIGFGAAFAMHRVSPVIALGLAWLAAILQMVAGAGPDAANLAILVVLYATARYGDRIVRGAGLVSALVGAAVAALYLSLQNTLLGVADSPHLWFPFTLFFIGFVALLTLSWTLGLLARNIALGREFRRGQVEAERAALIERERNRIARDMHDVVAHSLAVVIAQADGARYASAADPAVADAALATIAATAREALADVRLLLGQLRTDSATGPQPTLADLDALVGQMRASGLDVHLERDLAGERNGATIPVSAQLVVFRVLQEALTNALRHGDVGRPVDVDVRHEADRVVALVANGRRAGDPDTVVPGHGLTGMRERAYLIGGTLDARAIDDRFVVRLDVPVRPEAVA